MSGRGWPTWEELREREKLHFAASGGELDEVRLLVAEGRDVNASTTWAGRPCTTR